MCLLGQSYCAKCRRLHMVAIQRCDKALARQPTLERLAIFTVSQFCWSPSPGCSSLVFCTHPHEGEVCKYCVAPAARAQNHEQRILDILRRHVEERDRDMRSHVRAARTSAASDDVQARVSGSGEEEEEGSNESEGEAEA